MEDAIDKIRELGTKQHSSDNQLRNSFRELSEQIFQSLAGIELRASSESVSLEEYGDDEAVYGHLFYDGKTLAVAYRTTENDWVDTLSSEHHDRVYDVKYLDDCPIGWLRVLATREVLDSFFEKSFAVLEKKEAATQSALTLLSTAAKLPTKDASVALSEVARVIGYDSITQEWIQVQSILVSDPAEAVTRASSMLESVCKHILNDFGVQLPNDLSLQPLLKSTLKTLRLSTDEQISQDLQQVVRGIISVVNGIGSLRTHAGTAHGRGKDESPPTSSQARFATNSAGAAATFLMETASQQKSKLAI